MKRQIRCGVFETNSSSTHSVSITNRRELFYADIPKNSEVILDDTFVSGTDIFDEMGKLNFVVTMLASIVENECDYKDLSIESFEEMVELDWFKWLAEVVKEESNTDVIYRCPVFYNGSFKRSVPYYDTTYDEVYAIEDIFTDCDLEVLKDKEKFKERVKTIIYDKSVIIEDKENEY